jgi:hypothetical protein
MAVRTPRAIAAAGVVATAVATTFLVMPAIRQLGWPDYWWLAAVILFVPTAALLVATGFAHYGFWRSVAVAVVVMGITSAVTLLVAVFTLAAALSGSSAGTALGILLFATPGVLVLIMGLVSLLVIPARPEAGATEREQDAIAPR